MVPTKYLVFISSTFKHMEKARKSAIAGVSDARHIPISLDNFAPQNASDLEVIKQEVDTCQIYILLLGPTYGEIPKGGDRSYIEVEFDLAEKANRWIMVFTLSWQEILEQRQEFLRDDRYRRELENTSKLEAFYRRIRSGKHFYRTWSGDNVEQIRRDVGRKLTELPFLKDAPKGLVPEPDAFGEIVDSVTENEFLRKMVEAIRNFEKLYDRIRRNVEAKRKAAAFVAERYGAAMESDSTRGIFFESGSSVVFVADELPKSLWEKIEFGLHGEPSKRISTNNVLVYLLLWLSKGVPCASFPWGVPEETYGASYGPIGELKEREPRFDGCPLDPLARNAIASLGEAGLALTPENTSLIITAASGLQLGEAHEIVGETGYAVPETVRKAVEGCYGPHVGSYKNKVLKRYLYETGIPTVLVLDSSKIDCPIDVGKCHFIFGEDLTWDEVVRRHPLALCVGCKSRELDALRERVTATLPGLEIVTSAQVRRYSALLARNEEFQKAFPEFVPVAAA